MLARPQRHGHRHRRAAVGGRAAAASRRRWRAPPGAPGARRLGRRARRLRPGPRAPRRAARAPAAALLRQRGGVGDVPRPRLHPRLGRARRGPSQGGSEATAAGAPYAYLIYPHKPIVAYLPQTRPLLNEYCVAFPDETRPYGSARLPDSDDVLAKWMALTGDERRLIADGEHAPARPPGRPPPGPARPLAAAEWERERTTRERRREGTGSLPAAVSQTATRHRLRPQAPQPRPHRGPAARRRARLPQGHRLRRRGPRQADHRRRLDVDRDDAVQLPPARARREGQGGHPRGRRHADGVQHDRDLRRDHDGHERDEDVARQPRGDRRLDRARRARAPVRRRRRARAAATRRSPAP